MSPDSPSPLERAREDALRWLVRLNLWGFLPVALTMAAFRWTAGPTTDATRATVIISAPLGIAVTLATLLRPSTGRPLMRRGQLAVGLMSLLAGWGLLFNGPQAANAVGLAIVASLAVLFLETRRAFWLVMAANAGAGMLGLLLRQQGLLPVVPAPRMFPGMYELATGVLMVMGLAYSSYLLWETLQNYHRGQQELERRAADLLAAEASAQRLQRQEMLARLSTVLAGEVAEQLGALDEGAAQLGQPGTERVDRRALTDLREAGARAMQLLRMLASLGPATAEEPQVELRQVLQRVAEALQRLLGADQPVDVVDVSTRGVNMPPSVLERLLTHLALTAREGAGTTSPIVIRAYDGLGDMSRSDDQRNWTIVELGCDAAGDGPRAGSAEPAPADHPPLGELLVEMIVANAGGRFDRESRTGGVNFVLQLPSA